MKIAIVGAGAMGCRFGYMLTKTGQEVTLIGRMASAYRSYPKEWIESR